MSRRVCSAIAALVLPLATAGRADAQDWGIKGGVSLDDVKWGEEVVLDTATAIGAVGGAFVRVRPAGALSLQVEGLISQNVIDFSAEGVELTHTLLMVQVPVLARYRFFSGTSVRVSAQGGASFDLVLTARENVSGATSDIRESVAPWGASLVAAADVEWNRWVFDVRYIFGVTEIYQVPGDEVVNDFPAKWRSIQVTAGFRF
jgi:hypothetical protein